MSIRVLCLPRSTLPTQQIANNTAARWVTLTYRGLLLTAPPHPVAVVAVQRSRPVTRFPKALALITAMEPPMQSKLYLRR